AFFFHAEDGIRDRNVTGVQTCALPISTLPAGLEIRVSPAPPARPPAQSKHESPVQLAALPRPSTMPTWRWDGRGSARITIRIASGAVAPRANSSSPFSP